MKKTLTYCFGSLLCLMTLASCQNGGSCCGQAATDVDLTGRLYPKVKTPTKSLVIVDLQNDDIEGQVAAIGLQGIVNRDSEQKIYVMNSRCKDNHGGWKTGPHDMAQMGLFWLDRVLKDIPQETLTLDATKSNPGFSALVEQYKKHIKGVVIYDPELVEGHDRGGDHDRGTDRRPDRFTPPLRGGEGVRFPGDPGICAGCSRPTSSVSTGSWKTISRRPTATWLSPGRT